MLDQIPQNGTEAGRFPRDEILLQLYVMFFFSQSPLCCPIKRHCLRNEVYIPIPLKEATNGHKCRLFSLLNCLRSVILNNYDDILLLRNNHCLLRQRRLLDVTYFKMSVEGGLYAKTSICFRGRVSLMCAFPSVLLDVIFCA